MKYTVEEVKVIRQQKNIVKKIKNSSKGELKKKGMVFIENKNKHNERAIREFNIWE